MDERYGGGDQPGIWRAWAAPTHEPAEERPTDSGISGTSGPAAEERPEAPSQPPTPTQPIGFPQPDYPGGGYGPPPSYFGPGQPGQPPGGGYGGYGGYGMPPGRGGPQPPRRRRGLSTLITYLAVAALAATAGGLVVSFVDSGAPPSASSGAGSGNSNFNLPSNGNSSGPASAGISQATEQKVLRAVEPGLVVINSSLEYNGTAAAGTGMIISKSGLVVTNNHVIDQTTGLSATIVTTGQKFPAKWLGYDKGSDVAVIQLEGASGLTTVPQGDSSTVKVGDPVIGVGNAGGTGSLSPVTGTITGVNQTITASDEGSGAAPERLTDMLQTDAAIIQGDSGGPLATIGGKVIGMITAASTNSYANEQSVGFAIPINKAITIARQIIAGRAAPGLQIGSTGFVGVLVSGDSSSQSTLSSPQAQLHQEEATLGGNYGPASSCVPEGNQPDGVPDSIAPVSSGTLVLGVVCGAPADRSGMVPGDVITKVAGQQVTAPASLTSILQSVHGGSTVPITWVTPSGQTVSRTVTVQAAPPQ